MDTFSRLIAAAVLLFACQFAQAYGLVTGVQGTVATLPAKVYGQSSAGTYSCGSNCTGTYSASCEAALADNKATFSATWPSASYGATTYLYSTTSPWTISCRTLATYTNNGTQTITLSDQVKGYCPVHPTTGDNQFSGGASVATGATCVDRNPATCPENATASGSTTCVCNLGYKGGAFGGVGSASSCSAYTCPTTSTDVGASSTPWSGFSCDSAGSTAGCVYEEHPDAKVTTTAGVTTYYGHGTYSGAPCQEGGADGTTSSAPPPEPAPEPHEPTQEEKCALGNGPPMCVGTVGGASVCVTCGSSGTESTETTDTPAGAASAPSGISGGTKTTETTCTGSLCTTTTTYKDSAGNVTGTTTSSGPKVSGTTGTGAGGGAEGTLCDVYPNVPACKITSFSGSCTAGTSTVACDGDAVQCAIAREQAKRNCELFEKTTPETTLAAQAIADGIEGASDHPKRTPDSTSLAAGFDQTNIVTGSCVADRTITVGGQSVTFGLSAICTPAAWLANVLVGMTALACLGIAFKGT